MEEDLLVRLARIVGEAHLLTGSAVAERARHFWNASPLVARAVVRPRNTDEVAAVLAACHAATQPVVTHGGVTGLVGGDRSDEDDIVLSLERMRDVETLDPTGRTLTVQAGVALQRVQEAAEGAGLSFGLDLGARGSCTIGGNIATNAGGLSVLRYGMMREQVLGLEVVLADGTVVSSMNALLKNNAGYDLKQLFIGSEGTLGIVTRAVLRLRAPTTSVETALLGFERFEQVTSTLALMDRELGGSLHAFEVIWQSFYRRATEPGSPEAVTAPLNRDYAFYAVIEARGNDRDADRERFERVLEHAFETDAVADGTIARSEQDRAELWTIRENVGIAGRGPEVFVYDISLPIASMEAYVRELAARLNAEWTDTTLYAYGHLADGNLHLQIIPSLEKANDESLQAAHHTANVLVYEPLEAIGGSISAEHGIGLDKKRYLEFARSESEIALMRSTKRWLDPRGILNPGKIV